MSRYQSPPKDGNVRCLVSSCPIGLADEPSHSATLVMKTFWEHHIGKWVEEHASYVFWELNDSTNHFQLIVDIYADFDQMNAIAFELKFGNIKNEIYF